MIRFFVKALITLAIVWFLLQGMDLDTVIDHVLGIDAVYLVIATVLGWLLSVVASVRWHYVIQATGHRLTWYRTFQITMVGTFFNQILPSAMGGDLVRIPYAHQSGLPLGSAVSSVILDRVVAMSALVLLVFVSLPLAFSILDAPHARWTLIAVAAGGLMGTAVLLGVAHIPGRLRHPVLEPVIAFSLSLREAVAGHNALAVFVSGIAVHLVRVLAVYVIVAGMQLDIVFLDCLILVPPALLVTALPISVGGWGIREGAFVVAFGFVGLSPEQAFALSAVFGITILVAALFGAPFWMFLGKPDQNQTT